MLWLVLRVFFYATVTFDCLKAAQVSLKVSECASVGEMPIRNTVEPVENAVSLQVHALKSVVRAKLREIFANQYPGCKFILRAYETENWPPGVDKNNSEYWTKSDLLRINERIPFYQFFPRDTVAEAEYSAKDIRKNLVEMECLTSVTLREDYYKCSMHQELFHRFIVETGQLNAKKINWRLLDRRQVPRKYRNVPLNGATTSNRLVYRNEEIMDNIHFYKLGSELNFEVLSRFNEFSSFEDNLDDCNELGIDGPHSKSAKETELEIHDDNKDNEAEFDIGIDNDCISEFSLDSVSIFESCLNGKASKPQKERTFELRKTVKIELKNIFKAQHPYKTFRLRDYEIRNWPEGVSITPGRWRRNDLEKIREQMHEFVFVSRPERLSVSSEFGLDKLDNLDEILDDSMTRKDTYKILLTRYREETGESNVLKINWNRLDRREVPDKYKNIQINSTTMNLVAVYKNPEIVSNLHFLRKLKIIGLSVNVRSNLISLKSLNKFTI